MGLLQPLNTDRGLTGFENAFNSYFSERDKAEERKRQDLRDQAQFKLQGLIPNQQGGFDEDANKQAMDQARLEQEQYQVPHQKQMEQIGLIEKGLTQNPEGGFAYTPQKLQQQAVENRLRNAQAGYYEDRLKHVGDITAAKEQNAANKDITAAQNYLGHDKNYGDAKKMLDLGDQAKNLIQAALTNPVAKNNIPTVLSNVAGHGQRLHSTTMEQQKGDQSAIERFKQLVQSAGSGTLTPKNAKEMMDFVETMTGDTRKSVQNMELSQAKKMMRTHPGMDLPTAFENITGEKYQEPAGLLPAQGLMPQGGQAPAAAPIQSVIKDGITYVKQGNAWVPQQ